MSVLPVLAPWFISNLICRRKKLTQLYTLLCLWASCLIRCTCAHWWPRKEASGLGTGGLESAACLPGLLLGPRAPHPRPSVYIPSARLTLLTLVPELPVSTYQTGSQLQSRIPRAVCVLGQSHQAHPCITLMSVPTLSKEGT